MSSVYLRPEFVGFLIQEEIPEAISEAEVTITTTQQQAILGQPVKWKKTISLDTPTITKIRLPAEATNISVNKIIESYSEEINRTEALLKEDSSPSQEEPSSSETKFRITGKTISGKEISEEPKSISNFFRNIFRLTGRAIGIEEQREIIEVAIEDNATEYEIEYETPAPYAIEEPLTQGRGKRVKIVGPKTLHYENVLAFTNLDESLNIRNPSNVKIKWVENNTYINPTSIQDTDNNGIYDYIEWQVQSLSTQTFNIIVITKAEHLDSDRQFISNIYEEVRELDNVWSEEIPDKDYVRITFEIKLDNTRDITVFPRIVSGNPKIEVYEADKNKIIAEFTSINSNEYNKVFLTNLKGSQDTFDLKVLGGSVEFDHIIDPRLLDENGTFFTGFEDGNLNEWTLITASGAENCTASTIDPMNGTFHAECQPRDTTEPASIMEIGIDTAGYENITFSYYRKLVGLDVADEFKARWNDSISLITVEETLGNSVNDADYFFRTFNLSSTADDNPNFKIRFECTAGAVSERCRIDNVTVQGNAIPSDTASPVINSISDSPDPVVRGTEITITANITDDSAVSSALVEIDETNYTMTRQSTIEGIEETLFTDDFELGTLNAKNWSLNSTGGYWAASTTDPMNGTYHAQAHQTGAGDLSYMEVGIDTSDHTNISFSYHRKLVGLDAADDFAAEWYSGAAWVSVEQLGSGSENNADYVFKTFNLSSTADDNPNFKIRFMCENGAVSEYCRIDNVTVKGIASAGPDSIWEYDYQTVSLGTFNYTVYSNDTSNNNATPQTSNFTVIETNITISEIVRDANDTALNTTLEIQDENNITVYNETKITHIKELPKGKYSIKVKPKAHKIKQIEFTDLNITIDIDELIDIDDPIDNQGYDALYAVNPSINFTNATITVKSTGRREIFECSDWNFTARTCGGNFTKIDEITEDYNITLNSSSPSSAYGEIIILSADHLDSNRTFISDIYEEVEELDGNWSETIPDQDYVRVKFIINLTAENDITVYPRIINGTPRIEVYEFNDTVLIAEFTNITSNQYNKVFLTSLNGSQDSFDLRIVNGSLEFDHIVDPQEFFEDCVSIADWTLVNPGGNPWNVFSGRCRGRNTDTVANMTSGNINLQGNASANLSFDAETNGLDANEYFRVYVSDDGSTYVQLLELTGTTADANYEFALQNFISLTSTVTLRGVCVDSANNEQCFWDNINVTSFPPPFPQWFDNSTDGTVAGTNVEHRVRWTDNTALSGYIFSFDNGTGTFINDSFVVMTGTSNHSNVTKGVNTTVGATIRWRVYANDSASQLNATDIFVYNTTAPDTTPPKYRFCFSNRNEWFYTCTKLYSGKCDCFRFW